MTSEQTSNAYLSASLDSTDKAELLNYYVIFNITMRSLKKIYDNNQWAEIQKT